MILHSKTIIMRLIEEDDAAFVLQLRTDEKYSKHLSVVNSDVNAQKKWIGNYKKDEHRGSQYYFIIATLKGTPCGTVRLYDLKPDSFCWGSWILNENKTRFAALESAFLVYDFGFDTLGYGKSHFDVRRENDKVISFHEKMGAIRVSEDIENIYFEITKESVGKAKEKLLRKIV